MKKLPILLIIFLLSNTHLIGQTTDVTQATNFYDVIQEYYSSPAAALPDSIKGEANEELERSILLWGQRLYPHGDFRIASNAMQTYLMILKMV